MCQLSKKSAENLLYGDIFLHKNMIISKSL